MSREKWRDFTACSDFVSRGTEGEYKVKSFFDAVIILTNQNELINLGIVDERAEARREAMRITKKDIGKTITIINRTPRKDFKKLSGKLLELLPGAFTMANDANYATPAKFLRREWMVESCFPAEVKS